MKVYCYGVTDTLEQNLISKDNSSSADEVIPTILTDSEVYLHFPNSTPLDPVLIHMNPAHEVMVHFFEILPTNLSLSHC
jgi:hypothetical protein